MRALIRRVLLFTLFTTIASPGLAVNLVTNPSFAGNLTGWMTGWNYDTGTTFDPANDATGVPGSGSAKNTFVFPVVGNAVFAIGQCIAAGPGTYTLGGNVLIPSGQAAGGWGNIFVEFSPTPGCRPANGFLPPYSVGVGTSTTGSFQTLSRQVTAPEGTVSILISGQSNPSTTGTHTVNFDDFVLDNGLAAPAAVPALGPLGLLALLAAMAVTGFSLLRR